MDAINFSIACSYITLTYFMNIIRLCESPDCYSITRKIHINISFEIAYIIMHMSVIRQTKMVLYGFSTKFCMKLKASYHHQCDDTVAV